MDPDWIGNILQGLSADILEGSVDLVPDVVVGRTRKQDTARFRDAFQASSDIDTVAISIAALNEDVAQIDADAE